MHDKGLSKQSTKKKQLQVFVIILFVLMIGLYFASRVVSHDRSLENTGSASWATGSDIVDVKTLFDSADVVAVGKVCDSIPELRVDVVFTMEVVELETVYKGSVTADERIEVLFTGGSFENYYSAPIQELPLLEQGKEYLFFLELSPEDEVYGQYYLICGGYKGIAEVDGSKYISLSKENEALIEDLNTNKDLFLANSIH